MSNESRGPRGIDGADGLSQEEIALRLGISRARVSQIEREAFRKMRALARPEFLDLLRIQFQGGREQVSLLVES